MADTPLARRLMAKSRDDMRSLTADIDSYVGSKTTMAVVSQKITDLQGDLTALAAEIAAP